MPIQYDITEDHFYKLGFKKGVEIAARTTAKKIREQQIYLIKRLLKNDSDIKLIAEIL